jgi:hypothetical protein
MLIQRRCMNCASFQNIWFHLYHRVDGWRETPYFFGIKIHL